MIYYDFPKFQSIKRNKGEDKRKTHLHREPCRSHKSSKPTNVNHLSLGILHQDPKKSFYFHFHPSSFSRHRTEHRTSSAQPIPARTVVLWRREVAAKHQGMLAHLQLGAARPEVVCSSTIMRIAAWDGATWQQGGNGE